MLDATIDNYCKRLIDLYLFMNFPRASGILLHPTSLPGDYGIGDIGPKAFEFVDFLVRSDQTYWQILPLGPTGYGDSPYQCFSAFAGNPLLISPEKLVEDGLLSDGLTQSVSSHLQPFATADGSDKVDFGSVYDWKDTILPEAYKNFHPTTSVDFRGKFEIFVQDNAAWLDDYALYKAIKTSQGQKAWYQWPDELKLRIPDTLKTEAERLYEEIQAERFYQSLFYSQWHELKEYANKHGVIIVGDMPIFIALDSSDVWCNQEKFKLNDDGLPKVVAGVPPDYFSETGQLWGNPIYDWDAMRADNFGWWTARVAFVLKTVDVIRLDHFIGFSRNWEVPGGDKTAENGKWVNVPGRELFSVLGQRLGEIPIIAEDLGASTPNVEELRDAFGFPGMRILQYAFSGDAKNRDMPHNYIRNCVAYTGTHDNDTAVGWYRSASKTERALCRKYLHVGGREIHWDMIRAVQASVANTAIVPAQDILGLGTEARMNTPATDAGNWEWRLDNSSLADETADTLREISESFGRAIEISKNLGQLP